MGWDRSLPCLNGISSFDVFLIIPIYVFSHHVCYLQRYSTKLNKLYKLKLGYLFPNYSQDFEELDPLRQFNLSSLVPISICFSQTPLSGETLWSYPLDLQFCKTLCRLLFFHIFSKEAVDHINMFCPLVLYRVLSHI